MVFLYLFLIAMMPPLMAESYNPPLHYREGGVEGPPDMVGDQNSPYHPGASELGDGVIEEQYHPSPYQAGRPGLNPDMIKAENYAVPSYQEGMPDPHPDMIRAPNYAPFYGQDVTQEREEAMEAAHNYPFSYHQNIPENQSNMAAGQTITFPYQPAAPEEYHNIPNNQNHPYAPSPEEGAQEGDLGMENMYNPSFAYREDVQQKPFDKEGKVEGKPLSEQDIGEEKRRKEAFEKKLRKAREDERKKMEEKRAEDERKRKAEEERKVKEKKAILEKIRREREKIEKEQAEKKARKAEEEFRQAELEKIAKQEIAEKDLESTFDYFSELAVKEDFQVLECKGIKNHLKKKKCIRDLYKDKLNYLADQATKYFELGEKCKNMPDNKFGKRLCVISHFSDQLTSYFVGNYEYQQPVKACYSAISNEKVRPLCIRKVLWDKIYKKCLAGKAEFANKVSDCVDYHMRFPLRKYQHILKPKKPSVKSERAA